MKLNVDAVKTMNKYCTFGVHEILCIDRERGGGGEG